MKVLISGFEAFGGRDENPTALLIEALKNKHIPCPSEMTVDQVLLPVTFESAFHVLQDKISSFNPDVVIAFGQAAGSDCIRLEDVAVNKIDAEIKDNQGIQPKDQMINHLGAPSFLSTLPVQGIEGALKDAGIPVRISNSAGNFVCNYVFYRLMETNQDTLRLCGFVHVPSLDDSFGFEELKKTVWVILNYINY